MLKNAALAKHRNVEVMFARQFRQWFFFGLNRHLKLKSVRYVSTLPVEAIIGKENRIRCIARLQEMKPVRMQPSANPPKKAAVLVPLCMVNQELSLLYTLRSSDLKNYRGQVSFPGGMHDKTDADLEETALRETSEELGITKDQIDVWGHGSLVGTVSKEMSVLPYIAYIGHVNPKSLKLNPKEVELAFSVPLSVLSNPSNYKYTQFRDSYVLPVFLGGKHRIWGMTAIITHILLGALMPNLYKHKLKFIKPVRMIGQVKSEGI